MGLMAAGPFFRLCTPAGQKSQSWCRTLASVLGNPMRVFQCHLLTGEDRRYLNSRQWLYEVKPALLVLIFASVLHFLKAIEVMIYLHLLTSVLELEECPLYNSSPLVEVGWGKARKPCVHIHRGGECRTTQTQFWKALPVPEFQHTGAELPEKKMYRVPCEMQEHGVRVAWWFPSQEELIFAFCDVLSGLTI